MTEKNLTRRQQATIEQHVEKHLSKHSFSKAEFFSQQFRQHVSTAIIAAFSFLIALAWKDLIVHLVEFFLKKDVLENIPYLSDLITAAVVSVIAVLGILIVTRWAKRPEVLVSESKTK